MDGGAAGLCCWCVAPLTVLRVYNLTLLFVISPDNLLRGFLRTDISGEWSEYALPRHDFVICCLAFVDGTPEAVCMVSILIGSSLYFDLLS